MSKTKKAMKTSLQVTQMSEIPGMDFKITMITMCKKIGNKKENFHQRTVP